MIHILIMGVKIVIALCFILLPGFQITHSLKLAKSGMQILPMSFGVTLILLSLCDIPLMFCQLNVLWLVPMWCLISLVLFILLIRTGNVLSAQSAQSSIARSLGALRRAEPDAVLNLINVCLLALLVFCLFTAPGFIGGEEEVELISTRKILENHHLTFYNFGHVPNIAPTYLLTPLYLLRAFLSILTRIDPVLMHYRLGFLPPLIAILSVASISHVLTRSELIARMMIFLSSLCALLAPLKAYLPFVLPGNSGVSHCLAAPNAFYRATCSIQIATPICILFMLLAVTERSRWGKYAVLFLLMLMTTVQLHATAAVYLVELLGLCLLAFAFAGPAKNIRAVLFNGGVLRSALMLAAAGLLLFAYKQCFNFVHQETESIYVHQRPWIYANLISCFHDPVRAFFAFPDDVWHYDYFQYRGVHYDWSCSILFLLSGPPTLVAYSCSFLYLFFKRAFAPNFLFLVFLCFPFFLRLPILSISALMLNDLVFNDLIEHLALFCFMTLYLAAILVAHFAGRCLLNRGLLSPFKLLGLLGISVLVSYYLLGDIGYILKVVATPQATDMFIGKYCLFALLIVFSLILFRKHPLVWDFSNYRLLPTLLIASALVLPMVSRDYYNGLGKSTVLRSLPRQIKRLARLKDPYEQYAQNIWAKSNLTKGLFDCLMFVRESVPKEKIFAADPAVIRTVPLLTNEFALHSGVPFDFVESYFNRYYKPTVPEDDVLKPNSNPKPYVMSDPFFQQDQPLSADALLEDARFAKDFNVDYVLITPKFYKNSKILFDSLNRSNLVKSKKLYDNADYAVYQIVKPLAMKG